MVNVEDGSRSGGEAIEAGKVKGEGRPGSGSYVIVTPCRLQQRRREGEQLRDLVAHAGWKLAGAERET